MNKHVNITIQLFIYVYDNSASGIKYIIAIYELPFCMKFGIWTIHEMRSQKKKSSTIFIRHFLFWKNIKFNTINDQNRIQKIY